MRVIAYARFSSEKQSPASIEDQFRNCRRYTDSKSWSIMRHIEDCAISGTSTARPGYQELLAAVEKRELDVLIVDELSRLTRNNAETLRLVELLKRRRVRLIGVSDGFDSDTKGYKLAAGLHGLMNEAAVDAIRERTHRGLYGKVEHGFSAGGRSYGYKGIPIEHPTKKDAHGRPEIEAVRREIEPEQAKWVVQIFEWFAAGKSARAIAAELNRLNILSPRGATWCASAIHGEASKGTGILNNPLYNGKYVWNRSEWMKNSETGKRTYLPRPESEWVTTNMPELRIVPQELWDAVQARQADTRRKSAALRKALNNPKTKMMTGKYLFSGLLKCACCGASYVMCSTTSYGCSFNLNRGEAACANGLRLSRKVAEEALLETIQGDLCTDDNIDLYIKELETLLRQKGKEPQPELEANRQALATVEKQIANLVEAVMGGGINQAIKAALDKAEAEKAKLEAAVKVETVLIDDMTAFLPNAADRYKQMVGRLQETLQKDTEAAHQHLKTLIGTVKLHPNVSGEYLEAEVQYSVEGLLTLAVGEKFKVDLVAGAGFEPAAFRL